MKFLIDAQLPKSLSDFLNKEGYNSIHTIELPQRNETKDSGICELADREGRIVITKDRDFSNSFFLRGTPKKLILVKTGNIHNQNLIALFRENLKVIIQLISENNLLEITTSEIIILE